MTVKLAHASHRGYAVVETKVTASCGEEWRAICRHPDCVAKHSGNHMPVFWYQAWHSDRSKADVDAQDHNDTQHPGAVT